MTVTPLPLAWPELAILSSRVGALAVSLIRNPLRAFRWGLVFTGAALVCSLLACLGFYLCRLPAIDARWSFETALFGRSLLAVDEVNAPLFPVLALLHFLTALATGRTKMR